MRNARPLFARPVAAGERFGDQGGGALFYTMSGLFLALFAFVLWYCPRHL